MKTVEDFDKLVTIISEIFLANKLTSREMLMVLRELESQATILMLSEAIKGIEEQNKLEEIK